MMLLKCRKMTIKPMTQKEKILSRCNIIPVDSLINYLNDGVVTLAELKEAELTPELEDEIQRSIAANEAMMWRNTCRKDTVSAYLEYLQYFPNSEHSEMCRQSLSDKEDSWWSEIKLAPSEEVIGQYLEVFPLGKYVIPAKLLLEDLPWLETCKINTEAAYLKYKEENPDKHQDDIKSILNSFRDEQDWVHAQTLNTSEAYKEYVKFHRYGKHYKEAQDIIEARSMHDNVINGLRENKNAYSAEDIQRHVAERTVTESEISEVLGEKWISEIMNYSRPDDLPIYNYPSDLQKGRTEVYFWGTPASGKTCTLGAVFSRAYSKGIMRIRGGAVEYLDALKNIFKEKSVNKLPNSTSNTCIYNMAVDIKDKNDRKHPITMIDIAGEIFKCIYYDSLGQLNDDDERKRILDTTFNYLKDKKNKKIMFFVVEYNGHDRKWNDNTHLNMSDYLNQCAEYLNDKKIISSSVNGIYVLVTKCDMMPCEYQEQAIKAREYVEEYFNGFWQTLKDICIRSGVRDLKVLPFSIGNVVAKQLCEFDGRYAKLVLDRITEKSDSTGNSFLDFLKG